MNDLQIVEHLGQRVLTTEQLAESYGTEPKKIRDNYSNNKNRYVQGKHYFKLQDKELANFKNQYENFGVVGKRASSVYLWTESGALMHAKSLNTDEAWEVYEKLVETYFRAKNLDKQLKSLSPQLQLLINMEIKQKQLEQEIKITKNRVSEIKETIINRNDDWRKDVNKKLRKIGFKYGDYKKFVDESYMLLEERAGCNLNRRLENLKQRMALEGATKTAIDKTNYLDVISMDKRLKEIYIGIVARMYVKYAA